jgi:F0F1-type ATP synthase delta subunit
MANPTLYKKKSIQDVKARATSTLTENELTRVNTVISKFFDLFKAKHLG